MKFLRGIVPKQQLTNLTKADFFFFFANSNISSVRAGGRRLLAGMTKTVKPEVLHRVVYSPAAVPPLFTGRRRIAVLWRPARTPAWLLCARTCTARLSLPLFLLRVMRATDNTGKVCRQIFTGSGGIRRASVAAPPGHLSEFTDPAHQPAASTPPSHS